MAFDEDPDIDFDFDERVAKLEQRGMIFNPGDKDWLRQIGYYRVKPYWHNNIERVRQDDGRFRTPKKGGKFKGGTYFSGVRANYDMDAKLRQMLYPGLANVEVALREATSSVLQDRFGRYALYEPGLCVLHPGQESSSAEVVQHKLQKAAKNNWRSELRAVNLYMRRPTFENKWPVWQGVEIITFGELVTLFENLADAAIKTEIAKRLGYGDAEMLSCVLRQLTIVRNRCAHHGRIFNHEFMHKYDVPDFLMMDIPPILRYDPKTQLTNFESIVVRTYAVLTVLIDLNLRIDPSAPWVREMFTWLNSSEVSEYFLKGAGFPLDDWLTKPLWKRVSSLQSAA